jgi:hypothetical protein
MRFYAYGAIVLLAAAALCGCSRVNVHSARIRGIAYIRVNEVIKHDPLYPQLAQINDAIDAINLEATLPRPPLTAAQLAAQTAALNAELKAALDRADAIIASRQREYGLDEQKADAAALRAAGINPASAGIGSVMSATAAQQAKTAVAAAQQGYVAYQRSVITQGQSAMNGIAAQLNKEAAEKYQARAMQYQQDESNLSLQLAQQDAPTRLALKTKLNTLAMDAQQRRSITDQISAIDRREAAAVNALQARHARELAAYRKQLETQTQAAIRAQANALSAQTSAELSQRQNQVTAQLRGLAAAPVPRESIPPDVTRQLEQIHADYAGRFESAARQAVQQYDLTKASLDRQFEILHGQAQGATGAAANELLTLQERHDALQAQIQAQIQSEADRLAKKMGFSVVLDDVQAANGGYDLTNDLIHDVESLHE